MARGRHIVRLRARHLDAEAASYLLDWKAEDLWEGHRNFPQLTSKAMFGFTAPLEVEIGASTGEFLCSLAQAKPGTNFLGIDISRRAAAYAAGLAAERKLQNVRVLRANFKFLGPLMAAESWDRVYLHFPDPVHKHKDEKHRVFDRTFLDLMALVLVPGGEISVASDKPDYLGEMLALAESDHRFEPTHLERVLEFQPEVKSRFQRFWERKGVNARQFILRKK